MATGADNNLTKVDSAISGVPESPTADKKGHRRASSSSNNIWNVNDLGQCAAEGLTLNPPFTFNNPLELTSSREGG